MTKLKSLVATEEQECFGLMEWISLQPDLLPYFFHIPNGGTRSKVKVQTSKIVKLISFEGIRLKKMGVRAGVFDYFLAIPRGEFHGLFIEMKRKKFSTESIAQKQFQLNMHEKNYVALFCYGFEHAIRVIKDYLTCSTTTV